MPNFMSRGRRSDRVDQLIHVLVADDQWRAHHQAIGQRADDHAALVEHVIAHRLGILVGPDAERPHPADATNVLDDAILAELGCSEPEIAELRAALAV